MTLSIDYEHLRVIGVCGRSPKVIIHHIIYKPNSSKFGNLLHLPEVFNSASLNTCITFNSIHKAGEFKGLCPTIA